MGCALIRKQRPFWVLICLAVLTVLFLCGCDPRSGQYPFQKAESWSSADPAISLHYTQNEDNTWTFAEELRWNNDTIEIDVAMQSDAYCVYPADSSHYDDRLFSGHWKYRKGNLVLIIEEDFLFDGAYSEIVLVPKVD